MYSASARFPFTAAPTYRDDVRRHVLRQGRDRSISVVGSDPPAGRRIPAIPGHISATVAWSGGLGLRSARQPAK